MERQHPLSASLHGSVRSRESSSTAGSDAREKIKDCCRKFIAFMFTQVGVGALVVCYAILGAAGFMHIEKDSPDEQLRAVRRWRASCAEQLWDITVAFNTFNETAWVVNVNKVLKVFQDNITVAVHTGYSGRAAEDIWSFPAALMYSLSVFTMIGYGNIVPKTVWGKLVTIAYACFGIPIYVLYFCNMGKVLAQSFKWLYITAHECSRREDPIFEDGEVPVRKKITVPSTACLWVISFYILTGTIMFGAWEKWNYLDSTYFCVISLCKIGFGDFVPGANISDSAGGSHLKLVINFIYVLLGMGLVAMCYNLMCEDVRVKVRELRQDLKNCLDDITLKITVCMNDTKYYHQKQNRHIKLRVLCPMVLRLARVAGQEARANDVVFQPAVRRTARPRALVFFGGDVQDYSEAMRSHRDNRRYLRWSLERTTRRLAACFPAHHVLAVRPARIERKMLSCYDNFVPSDCAGVPRFTPAHGALAHLHSLLQNLSLRLRETPSSELLLALAHTEDDEIDAQAGAQSSTTPCQAEPSDAAGGSTVHAAESPESPDPLWWVCGLRLERCELALAGFSKGCVVLNQLVHELHHGGAQPPGLVSQISSLYWLDGGHAGGRDTWLTARPLLHTLAQLDVNIFVHVSPYQVRDEARPWIRREEKIFTNTLTKLGAKVSRYFHASPAPYSLLTHFSVLDNFKRVQDEDHPGLDTHNK